MAANQRKGKKGGSTAVPAKIQHVRIYRLVFFEDRSGCSQTVEVVHKQVSGRMIPGHIFQTHG